MSIKTNALGYAISRILSQLILDDSSQSYLLAFFSRMIILAETWYETYEGELLAIVKAFKI